MKRYKLIIEIELPFKLEEEDKESIKGYFEEGSDFWEFLTELKYEDLDTDNFKTKLKTIEEIK